MIAILWYNNISILKDGSLKILSIFLPKKYYKSVYDINYDLLKKENIKLIGFDLDNTLVPHYTKYPSKEIKEILNKLNAMGFVVIIISNNNKIRVEKFVEDLDVDGFYGCKKPLKFIYKEILNKYSVQPDEIALVGDQIFTDVLGANRMKMISVLVDKIADKDIIYTKINRQLEKIFFKFFAKRRNFKVGEYYE